MATVARQHSNRVVPQIHSSHFPSTPHEAWRDAADALRRNRLGELASLCLDVFAPIAPVVAQLLHATGPFLGDRAAALARVLESDQGVTELAQYLAEDQERQPLPPEVPSD